MKAIQRLWFGTLMLTLALSVWILWQPRPASPALVAPRASSAPALPLLELGESQEAAEAATLLATSSLWGPRANPATAAASATPPAPPRWWIGGVLELAGQPARAALHYENGAQPTQWLRVGDSLPDGRRIVELNRGGVRLQHSVASLRQANKAQREALQAQRAAQPGLKASAPPPIAKEEWLPLPRRRLEPN